MKKNLYYIVLLLSVAVVVGSCIKNNSGNDQDGVTVDVGDLIEVSTGDQFCDIISEIEFVPLETGEDYLLGDIKKVIETDSAFYVLANVDSRFGQELHVFDKSGRHIKQISHKGEAPDEYARLGSFTLIGDTLYLYDDYKARIKEFTKHGVYRGIESVQMQVFGISDITPLGDDGNLLVTSDITSYSPNLYSTISPSRDSVETAVVSHQFSRDETYTFPLVAGHISDWDDASKLVLMPFSQTLYKLDNSTKELSPCIHLQSQHPVPLIEVDADPNEYMKSIDNQLYIHDIPIAAYRNGDWLIVNFFQGGILWNIDEGKGYKTLNGLSSDKGFPLYTSNIVSCSDESGIICWFNAQELLSMKEKAPADAQFMPSDELCSEIQEDSNPILVRYRLKRLTIASASYRCESSAGNCCTKQGLYSGESKLA